MKRIPPDDFMFCLHPDRKYMSLELPLVRSLFIVPKYQIDDKIVTRLNNDFQYHAPKEDQQERYVFIRDNAKRMAITICENTPPSREQSVALTLLDQVVMMANAAIARNE